MKVWPANQFRVYAAASRFDGPFRASLPPAGPSAPIGAILTGDAPGQIKVQIAAPPAVLGDGPVQGDELGVVTDYLVSIAGGPFVSQGTTLPIEVVSGGHAEGAQIPAAYRALGFNGWPGALFVGSASAAVTPPVTPNVLLDKTTGDVLINKISGDRLVMA